jgi:very-short-patch-repair endonuclease
MLVYGLDGKEYKMTMRCKTYNEESKSSYHKRARILLKDVYPFDTIREEILLPGTKTTFNKLDLFADFFIPSRRMIIEVNGSQHSTYNRFFHRNKLNFLKAKHRDAVKKQWCDLNKIELIEFNYNESIDEWRTKLGN